MLNDLISNLHCITAKNLIANFLANERNNQINLARSKGLSEETIKNNIHFNIFVDTFKPLETEDLPCVIIDIENTNYPANMQYNDKLYANSQLNFYLFSNGYSTEENNEIINDDKMASKRLDYLLSQVLNICQSEYASHFGTEINKDKEKSIYIDKKKLISFERSLLPQDNNSIITTLNYIVKYEISYFEYTQQLNYKDLKELYTTLAINNQFIDPFVQILYNKNK